MVDTPEYKSLKDLFKRLKEEGITGYSEIDNFRNYWIYPREKNGSLLCPKDTSKNHCRVFTDQQIEEIVTAFKPGGSGKWVYHE